MLNAEDKNLLEQRGITEDALNSQISRFKSGFPFLKIHSVASVGAGITRFSDSDVAKNVSLWKQYRDDSPRIEKFVPASGVASRMFKNIFAFINSGKGKPETDFEKEYFDGIDKFAFYGLLDNACQKLYNAIIRTLLADGRYVDVAKAMLSRDGLDYGFLPKGLIKFHRAAGYAVHTPVEEHLEEGAQYASGKNGTVNIHFTVSPEHRAEFEKLLKEKIPTMEKIWGVKYAVSLSEQKLSTDTIAVTLDNEPYRTDDGKLFFRPAGHGALIENLGDLDADVVFVKNIDNVVPLKYRNATVKYKKAIAGYLVWLQRNIARNLTKLEGDVTPAELKQMLRFLESRLSTVYGQTGAMTDAELKAYLIKKFNRPIRVCGVVKNEGEPGGGPYLAYNADGSYSPQILESAQIDANNPEAVALMQSGTHFNPVDLVCYLKDYKGHKFNLKDFVDYSTGLISEKSVGGVDIKALELPGLWNGSMSDWNTAFVEVPIETFNPVKTVNDLLRKQHQA